MYWSSLFLFSLYSAVKVGRKTLAASLYAQSEAVTDAGNTYKGEPFYKEEWSKTHFSSPSGSTGALSLENKEWGVGTGSIWTVKLKFNLLCTNYYCSFKILIHSKDHIVQRNNKFCCSGQYILTMTIYESLFFLWICHSSATLKHFVGSVYWDSGGLWESRVMCTLRDAIIWKMF